MKKFKTLGYVLSLALGMTMLTGCGKKVDGVDQQSMIDKYAAYCDLPDYKGLEYEETKSIVTDADVKTKIDSLLQQYATKTQVKEGTVKEGDNVNIDFVGSIDGEEFEGGNSNGAGYDLTLGSGAMIPGFEDGIIGHKVGETFNIKATFPENYGKDELNGKEADFKITINYITETELPEYNDAFVASDMQNVEPEVCFYDIFEKQELFDIWQIHNYKNYVCDGPSPMTNGLMLANAKSLVENIMDSADAAIASGTNSATFRFGHDGNVIPLVGLLRLENCYNEESDPAKFYQAWCNFKMVPMAANVQIVFFRKKGSADDIIVKFMLNEKEVSIPVKTDIAPFYHWKDVRAFYKDLLSQLPDRP